MQKFFIFIISVLSINSYALDTTYLQCYGVKDSFTPRSELIKKSWAFDENNQYLKLEGHWKDNTYNAITENYFIVKSINAIDVTSAEVHAILTTMCSNTLAEKYSVDFTKNIIYFATDNAYGYEYPILSEQQALALNNTEPSFSYNKILRYAFAASYIYSTEPGSNSFSFYDDPVFTKLMLATDSNQITILDTFVGNSGVYGIAIKVPAIPSENLEEEVIISFKGTSSNGDVFQDIELMLANLTETDEDWQLDAYNFVQSVIEKFPPNARSIAHGYQNKQTEKSYNVVLTGHSLGGYTAIDAGVRTGILTRTFSSPATRIIENYIHVFANKMRYSNVINMVRERDPVSTMSGRHNENMIYFPGATGTLDPGRSHYLTPFINDILKPLAQ